jgi:hypothetical protein
MSIEVMARAQNCKKGICNGNRRKLQCSHTAIIISMATCWKETTRKEKGKIMGGMAIGEEAIAVRTGIDADATDDDGNEEVAVGNKFSETCFRTATLLGSTWGCKAVEEDDDDDDADLRTGSISSAGKMSVREV